MFSLETRVNGMLIGYAHVVRKIIIDWENYIYYVEYFRPEREPSVIRFNITHKREEGAEKLVLKVYREIDKILRKEDSNL